MRVQFRRSFVPTAALVSAFAVVLIAVVATVCAGAATPARAAALPARGVWSSVIGLTAATERWVDVAKGPDGSLYAGGDAGFAAAGHGADLLVAKFAGSDAAASHLLWRATWDNPAEHLSDTTSAIAVDHSGALIAVGATGTAASGREWLVAKWNAAGVLLWVQTYPARLGTAWNATAADVVCAASGAIYVAGTVQTGTHGGHAVTSLVVRKLGSDGHLIWTGAFAGPAHSANVAVRLALDGAGNAYSTGYGQSARGDNDIVTCRFAASTGHRVWVARLAGARHSSDQGTALALRGSALWVTGYETTSSTTRQVVLARYTTAGKRLWLRTWLELPKTRENPTALAVDPHGNAVVVGAGTDRPLTREHAFVVRYGPTGRLLWQRLAYDSLTHEALWTSVVCDAAGRIWTGGYAVAGLRNALLLARYSTAGAVVWTSQWAGSDALGAQGNALCFGKSGLFAAGVVAAPAGGGNALAVKLNK